jgi:prepilin-type N-terminal cleavage/methylation domain-containing protein
MRALNRRGFTLLELLVGLIVLVIFATELVVLVRGMGQVASRTSATLLSDRPVGSLRTFLEEELRDGADSDVTILSPSRIKLSRSIGEAIVCGNSPGAVLLRTSSWGGTRAPAGGRDIALLLVDAVSERWLALPIDSTSTDRCPADGALATRLDVAAHSDSALVVRIGEPVELSAYRSGIADWFGLTPASHVSAVQPFAGPLAPGTTRFSASPGLLTATIVPQNASSVALQLPLGSPP